MSGSLPASSLISVDFPAPFTPTSAIRSPRSMMKFDAAENELLAVAFRHVLKLGHDAAARLGLRKREVDGLLFVGQLDALDLFQFFDAALHLLGLGGLIAEAVDEGFQLLDALALVAIGGFQLLSALLLSAADTFRNCPSRNARRDSRSRRFC